MLPSYYAIVTCRNSELTIETSLLSLFLQSHMPEFVIVIDDGSTDKTPMILKEFQKRHSRLLIITNPDFGYDISRVVRNWNKAIELAKQVTNNKLPEYHMISADDIFYTKSYAQTILTGMQLNEELVVVSGDYNNQNASSPHGAGRFVRNSFFSGPYPDRMGYETWIVLKAMIEGKKVEVFRKAEFTHLRQLGSAHGFFEFGASMKTLGYHPTMVLGRFAKAFIKGEPLGRLGALHMLYTYLTFVPDPDGYKSLFDSEFRQKVRTYQKNKVWRSQT